MKRSIMKMFVLLFLVTCYLPGTSHANCINAKALVQITSRGYLANFKAGAGSLPTKGMALGKQTTNIIEKSIIDNACYDRSEINIDGFRTPLNGRRIISTQTINRHLTEFYTEAHLHGNELVISKGYHMPLGPQGKLGNWSEFKYKIALSATGCAVRMYKENNTLISAFLIATNVKLIRSISCEFTN